MQFLSPRPDWWVWFRELFHSIVNYEFIMKNDEQSCDNDVIYAIDMGGMMINYEKV